MEPCLDGVHEEDRPIVRNVVAVLQVIKKDPLFTTWTCHVAKGCYIVTAYIDDVDCEFTARELQTLHDVNPLRVTSVAIQRVGTRLSLKVRVSDRNEPIIITETEVVRVRKRSRFA